MKARVSKPKLLRSKIEGDGLAEVLIDADGVLENVLERLGWTKSKLLKVLEKDFKALQRALLELEDRGIDIDHQRLHWLRPVLQLHATMEDDDDWVRYRAAVLADLMARPERSQESLALLDAAVSRTDVLLDKLKALKPKKFERPKLEIFED